MEALQSDDVWTESGPAPRQFVVDVTEFAERAKAEDIRANAACDAILSGPASWWPQRLRQTEDIYTAGMVRALLDRMRQYISASPANALQVTAMALDIANALDVAEYPCDYVIKLRAQAYRDHAYVLSFMGRYREALETADRAKRLFEQVPLPEYDLARVAQVRALIFRCIDRADEALVLAKEAADTFLRFGDTSRYANARVIEGAILFEAARYHEALEVWTTVEHHDALDTTTRIGMIHNVAICYRELGQLDKAAERLSRCVEEHQMTGAVTERTRSRRSLGQTLVKAGRYQDAIPVLRQSWREFEELDLIADAGLAALELAEALLLAGQSSEVPAICRNIVARFTRAGMTSRAITALSFLREAVALGQGNPSLVRHVHDFLRELPAERPRLFAPSPGGSGYAE
ncbi:MAG TPA: tetratricopeptide repeat protein [Thermoanaerobaculia bacterium]|nr:tetratricopeptide repeat protein [Thermoanaerobaculia bacterium]